jgi:hypothetical protein
MALLEEAMFMRHVVSLVVFLPMAATTLQAQKPPVSQVLMYSATAPSVSVPSLSGNPFTVGPLTAGIFSETRSLANLTGDPNAGNVVTNASNYTVNSSFAQISAALNSSIATALSIIPLSSPASGVITRKDPATGLELGVSSTLGPIFTERAETIGKGHFYLGFSHQTFHFTEFNGKSLNALNLLYQGGQSSNVTFNNAAQSTVPASFGLGMDVRLTQDIAFLTYGLTDRIDVSLGLPMVHSAVAARTFNGVIYSGNGFNPALGGTCWCVNTFTPGYPTLMQANFNQSSASETGFGDLLVRAKGTVLRKPGLVVGTGIDLRFPTGDEKNYLGVGAFSAKPFVAVSLYSKPLHNGIVLSPHLDVG